MAVPKKRTTSAKRNHRRSHHGIDRLQLTTCPQCKQAVQQHVACANCGTYRGRKVIDVLATMEKKERKAKEQELAEQATAPAHDHDHSHAEAPEKKKN